MPAHYVLTTFGSLGDLHPYIAVATGLRERGHTVTIATSEVYRAKVEGEGLGFHPLRPDFSALLNDPEVIRRALHPRTGGEYLLRQMFLPWLEQTFEDTLQIAREGDMLVGHPIAFATPTTAEHLGKPWVSVALQPIVFLSTTDPPVISAAQLLHPLHSAVPGFSRQFLRFVRSVARRWGTPVNALRRRLGLPESRNPLIDDMFSPHGTQAWFSKLLANPQKDWPQRTTITGFPFYDRLMPGQGMTVELARFLDAGSPPVVFTLGSTAVFDAGPFYMESFKAVRATGHRAVLLIGSDPRNAPKEHVPDSVFVAQYEPYSELFSRAAAIVHQGGIGTTAQALRAGRPMIVVPHSHDQPDNANRVRRLGVARVIPRAKYCAGKVAGELKSLLAGESYRTASARAASDMQREDGVRAACDGLEAALRDAVKARR